MQICEVLAYFTLALKQEVIIRLLMVYHMQSNAK